MDLSVEVKIYKSPKKVVKAFAKELVKITHETDQPEFNLALSGGKTPKLLFQTLAKKHIEKLPWEKIHIWWGDERCVAPTDKESNYKVANDLLLASAPIPEKNIHRINGEANPEEEAKRYGNELSHRLNLRGDKPVFDLIILGLGNDGHTASIFPGNPELFETNNNCAVVSHPDTGQKRITLTGKVLNNSNRIFFLVTGKRKALRISEIMNDDEVAKKMPAYYIQPENGNVVWYIDEDAASLIS